MRLCGRATPAARWLLGVAALQEALVAARAPHPDAVLPGYTHLQRAQAGALGHHLAAHAWALERDVARLRARVRGRRTSLPWGPARWPARRSRSTRPARPPSSAFGARFRSSLDAVVGPRLRLRPPVRRGDGLRCTCRAWPRRSSSSPRREFGFVELDDTRGARARRCCPRSRTRRSPSTSADASGVAIGRLTVVPRCAQGAAAGLRLRPAGGQGARLRPGRRAVGRARGGSAARGGLRFDEARMAEAAADGACGVATTSSRPWCAAGTPFREAYEQVAAAFAAGRALELPSPQESVAAHRGPARRRRSAWPSSSRSSTGASPPPGPGRLSST